MNEQDNYLYSQPVLDFVRVSTEYCKYLEQAAGTPAAEFVRVMRVMLPMVYLKATLLGSVPEAEGWNDKSLTEADYDYIKGTVADIMGSRDSFLDVFVEDFKYSEQPVLCTVSENLADIYQELRELAEVFRNGCDEAMQAGLSECIEEFNLQWGQKLLNSLRTLHDTAVNTDEA